MSSNTRCIFTAEVAEIASELDAATVMYIAHVSFNVGLVHASITTEIALENSGTRIHLTGELHVSFEQCLKLETCPTMRANMWLDSHGCSSRPFLFEGQVCKSCVETCYIVWNKEQGVGQLEQATNRSSYLDFQRFFYICFPMRRVSFRSYGISSYVKVCCNVVLVRRFEKIFDVEHNLAAIILYDRYQISYSCNVSELHVIRCCKIKEIKILNFYQFYQLSKE